MRVSRRDNCDRYYLFQFLGFGIFLHKIHHDEELGIFHNHPWDWFSIILGSYLEERFGQPLKIVRWFNWARGTQHHRIILFKPVWTIFFHGRRYNCWEVINLKGEVIDTEPWRAIGGRTSYVP
jgi:hypothetical protein